MAENKNDKENQRQVSRKSLDAIIESLKSTEPRINMTAYREGYEPQKLSFPVDTPSEEIASASVSSIGVAFGRLEPVYKEEVVKEIERKRGWLGGLYLDVGFSPEGKFNFKVGQTPKSEKVSKSRTVWKKKE